MIILKNCLILLTIAVLAAFFVTGSFVFGINNTPFTRPPGNHDIKKSIASIVSSDKKIEKINYSPYTSGSTLTGILALDFGRLATAFVMAESSPEISFSGSHDIIFQNLQGIISLYDPFTLYNLHPMDKSYQVSQITNGSLYISDEPDGTVSIYSIDVVAELSFFNEDIKMTDMILFPGMYIRFDPKASRDLQGADLFRIMLVLGDNKNGKNTGLEFVNPRVNIGADEDIFFMFKLPITTRPLFQMLHILFRDRINQVDLIKNYASTRSLVSDNDIGYIYNPSKRNYYLLDDLKAVLSQAVRSNMDSVDFRSKIEKIHTESETLVRGNSVQVTLETFLTDARFAMFGSIANPQFGAIYTETANILKKTPDTGKGKFFQYLSDIYSRNIILQRKDPTFSGIDTYTPTADGLQRTLDNDSIESKDYFDIALYAHQLLQKAQDGQIFTEESLASRATYSLIETLFSATNKYIQGLAPAEQKSAYQTLVVQFYAPIANTISRSLYGSYATYIDQKIYLDKDYLDGDVVKFDPKIKENLDSINRVLRNTYEGIFPLYDNNEQQYALISFRDSLLRIQGFIDMVDEGKYRDYQKAPYVGIDIGGIFSPSITSDGKIEIFQLPSTIPIKEVNYDSAQDSDISKIPVSSNETLDY